MDKKEHNLHSGRIQRAAQENAPLPVEPGQASPGQNIPKQTLSDSAFQAPKTQQRMQAVSLQGGQTPTQSTPPAVQEGGFQNPQNFPSQRHPSQRQTMPQQGHPENALPYGQDRPGRPQGQPMPQQMYQVPVQNTAPPDWENAPYEPETSREPTAQKKKRGHKQRAQSGGRKQKNGKFKVVLSLVLVFVLLLGGGAAFALGYLDSLLNTDLLGFVTNYIPKDYSKSDVVNVLIVGIDNEEGRDYGAGLGMTDMILYANFDIVNNKLNLLQIPRDSYVGEEVATGGTGKINAALISGEDSENPINNLVKVVEEQFLLPVDHYIAMDMDGMKAIVDTFGGLRVYVPQEMSYNGSYLPAGWQWLNGDAAEFFVRNRSGVGFEQADISRLDNQRFFYSALFRRFMNLAPQDIVNLLPVFEHYCSTDIGLTDIFDLAYTALNLQAENVLFCKVPGATDPALDPSGQGRSLYYVDVYGRGTEEEPGTANLLNQYFRSYGEPVPAEELGLPNIDIPESTTLYSPNVQVMSSVQDEEGGADINVEPQYE